MRMFHAYYHGGIAGLPVGSFILPSAKGSPCPPDWIDLDDFCYVTTSLLLACWCALNCEDEGGTSEVYRVKPWGRLQLDLCESGQCFAVKKARILARSPVPDWLRERWKTDQAFMDELMGLWVHWARG
jgi:hypothetical protein